MATTTRPRTRRNTRRSEKPPIRKVVIAGTITIAVFAIFILFAIEAQKGVPGRSYHTMYVTAPETGSLRGNDKVAIGGVRVGRVVDVTAQANHAQVKLQLEPDVSLPSDTTVRLRANGLLGARYVQLIPGTSTTRLKDGSTIKGGPNALTATVPDALDVFDSETRGALGTAVTGLGRGVAGNGELLNDGIRQSSKATIPFQGIMDAITSHPGAAEALVPDLDSGVTALDNARGPLGRLFQPAAQALKPFGDETASIRSTLDIAPSALTTATGGLNEGTNLLAAVNDLAVAAQRTLPAAPRGLKEATSLLKLAHSKQGGTTPLNRATRLLAQAEPTVPKLLRVTSALKPVLPHADDLLSNATPILADVIPYGCGLENTGAVLRSMTGFAGTGDGPTGPSSQFRLQAVAGVESLGLKKGSDPIRDAYHAPCAHLAHHFDVTPGTGLQSGGGK